MRAAAERLEGGIAFRSQNDRIWNGRVDYRPIIAASLVFAGYFVGAKIGFALTFRPHPVSVLWPPNSILLAALLLTPVRIWWLILLAAFPAHLAAQLQSDVPPTMILCWFISNSCEAVIGAGCIRYFIDRPVRFGRLRNVGIFCFFAAFLGPFLSSFVDSAFVLFNHWGQGSYWEIWRIRFTSNVLAALTVTPLILTWGTSSIAALRKVSRPRLLEAILLFSSLILVSFTVLYRITSEADSALLYLPLPFLLWAAVRFGPRGTSTAVALVVFLAIWGVAHGHGPFSEKSAEQNALSVQIFSIFMSVPLMCLAALIEERATAEQRFVAAFRSSADAMIIDRRKDALIVDVNEHWLKMLGYQREEVIGRTVFDLNVYVANSDRQKILDGTAGGRQLRDLELSFRTKAGAVREVSLSADTVEMEGEPCLIVNIRDITDRKQAEEANRNLAHASRLAVVGELTASIAHELNQPLQAIMSNAAAGRRFINLGETNSQFFEELLSDVAADARRAGDIIHGVRDLVRKSEVTRRPVCLNQVIRDALRLLHSDSLERAAVIRTELAPRLPAVEADPIHLQQVMLNLLMNSFEAMQGTPVDKRRVLISTRLEADSFVITSVRDHGVGLPREDPGKIFDRFYSTKPDGMGMGLTIVRSIVEAHGGEVGAENLEEGARFFFRLPVAERDER